MGVKAVHSALIVRFQAINGSGGGYTHDLSGTDAVVYHQLAAPDRLPQLSCSLVRVRTRHGPELGDFEIFATFRVVGFVATSADTGKARVQSAEDLLEDVFRAIWLDRDLVGTVIDVTVDEVVLGGGGLEGGAPEFGTLSGLLTVNWFEDGTP